MKTYLTILNWNLITKSLNSRAVISHSLNLKTNKSELNILELIDLDICYFAIFMTIISVVMLFVIWNSRKTFSDYLNELMEERICKTWKTTRKHLSRKLTEYQVTAVCYILIAVYLLTFFSQIFVTNSFRTSNVLIKTDQIIYNNQQAANTY